MIEMGSPGYAFIEFDDWWDSINIIRTIDWYEWVPCLHH